MNENRKLSDIEDYMQSMIKTELPDSVSERLKEKMRERARIMQSSETSIKEPIFWLSVDWWHSLQGKAAFAFGSLLILVTVFFAHAAKPQSALSATIDAIRLAADTQRALQTVKAMQCKIRRDESMDRPPNYILQWRSPDEMFLDANMNDGERSIRIAERQNGRIDFNDGVVNSLDKMSRIEMENILDRYSNPENLFQSLRGIWKIVESENSDTNPIRAWIQPLDRLGSCVVWLDRHSKLPLKMETYFESESDAEGIYMDYWRVQFNWNQWGG